MRIFALLALVAVAFAADCTLEQVSSAYCANSPSTESACTAASCIWCPVPAENIPDCTSKSGTCVCVKGETSTTAGGMCVVKDGPSCTYRITGAIVPDGKPCAPDLIFKYSAGKCPVLSSAVAMSFAAVSMVFAAVVAFAF